MLRLMLRSKIHRATITEADLDYEGSLTLDEDLIEAAGMLAYEQIMVSNIQNGERFETAHRATWPLRCGSPSRLRR